MNLDLSDEQRLLKDTFERLFRTEAGPEKARAVEKTGFDPALWAALVELGAPTARVPEAAGGFGLSLHDAVIIAEEAGRYLAAVPLIEVMATARALALCGDSGDWLSRIGAGDAIVVLAHSPAQPGRPQLVTGGAVADAVLALDGEDLVLVSVPRRGNAPANIGQTPVAYWTLSGSGITGRREVMATGDEARRLWHATMEEWRLLSAAFLGGLSRQALELAAAYAKDRMQFGRSIGSFQAIAHPLADSVTAIDAGRLLVLKAVWATATGAEDAAALLSLSWWWLAKQSVSAVRRATRTLGGYGLALEYDLQLYNRRGNALVLAGGDPQAELDKAGERLFGSLQAALPDAGATTLDFDIGDEARAFGQRLSAFFAEHQTEEMRRKAHHSTSSHDKEFHQKLAQSGFIFGRWPADYGGVGRSPAEEYVILEQMEEWNYTNHVIGTTDMVAQMIMRFGTEEAKAEIIPRIKSGEAVCSLGFSEPNAGSDVFSARTKAVRDGDDWIIDGQKMFTTAAHYADYVILLARTDLKETRHKGLSLFIVPTALPGYSFQPVHTYQDERTNITFYTDIRLPRRYLLGEADQGSGVMAAALSLEHGGTHFFTAQQRMMKYALQWARTPVDGVAPIDDPAIRSRLAMVTARYEAANCFVARGIWADAHGHHHRAWGPMAKMFISDTYLESCWEILEMAGPDAVLTGDHPLGFVELGHRRAYGQTIYGGSNEIHRSMIAEQMLGLPKSRS